MQLRIYQHVNIYIYAYIYVCIYIAARTIPDQKKYVEKKDFGQVPGYLKKINENIQREYESLREM